MYLYTLVQYQAICQMRSHVKYGTDGTYGTRWLYPRKIIGNKWRGCFWVDLVILKFCRKQYADYSHWVFNNYVHHSESKTSYLSKYSIKFRFWNGYLDPAEWLFLQNVTSCNKVHSIKSTALHFGLPGIYIATVRLLNSSSIFRASYKRWWDVRSTGHYIARVKKCECKAVIRQLSNENPNIHFTVLQDFFLHPVREMRCSIELS